MGRMGAEIIVENVSGVIHESITLVRRIFHVTPALFQSHDLTVRPYPRATRAPPAGGMQKSPARPHGRWAPQHRRSAARWWRGSSAIFRPWAEGKFPRPGDHRVRRADRTESARRRWVHRAAWPARPNSGQPPGNCPARADETLHSPAGAGSARGRARAPAHARDRRAHASLASSGGKFRALAAM